MARYKQPLVVKDVFIPLDTGDDGCTLKQYKEKYGIDLSDIFDIKIEGTAPDDFLPFSLKTIAKLYFIDIDGLMSTGLHLKNAVYPVSYVIKNNDITTNLLISGVDEVSWISMSFVNIGNEIHLRMSATNL